MPTTNTKLQNALEAYEQGKTTLWKAAKDCRISLWEMIEEVKARGIYVPYRLKDLKEDLAVKEARRIIKNR